MKYPWWERWASLTLRAYPNTPAGKVASAIDVCGWFVEHHALEAEQHGWRPVHIMHPRHGLAWRWWSLPSPHLFIEPTAMVADWQTGIPFAYRPSPDGTIQILTGPEREKAIANV